MPNSLVFPRPGFRCLSRLAGPAGRQWFLGWGVFLLGLTLLAGPVPTPPDRSWQADGVSTPDTAPWPANVVNQLLGAWLFDSPHLASSFCDGPWWTTNVVRISSGAGYALRINSSQPAALRLAVRQSTTNGDFSVRNGTVAFWFRPAWSSGGTGSPTAATPLLEVGAQSPDKIGWWVLQLNPKGNELSLLAQSGGKESRFLGAPVGFIANTWSHVALTWSPTNSRLFLNGRLVTNGVGITRWPALAERERWGWGIGGNGTGTLQARGDFDDLLTFNHPLSLEAVARLASGTSGSAAQALALGATSSGVTSPRSGLWLQALPSVGGRRPGWLHGTKAGVKYELFGATHLPGPWRLEGQLSGVAGQTAYELPADTRNPLFLVAVPFADQDADSLSDEYERRVSRTQPNNADTDGDGMPDGWEVANGLHPNRADELEDPDKDGFPNGLEFQLGRDPQMAEPVPLVTVSASASTVSEASTGANFVIRRTAPLDRALEVFFELRGRAAQGADYEWIGDRVTIPAGSAQANVAVRPIDDTLDEVNETVVLELLAGAEYGLGASPSASLTLIDNDLPVVSITALDADAREPQLSWTNPGELELRRSGLIDRALKVSLTYSGTANRTTDLESLPSSVTIPAGEVAVRLPVIPKDNKTTTGERTLIVTVKPTADLYTASASESQATVRIQDIQVPVVTVVASDADAAESSGGKANPGQFKFSRTGSTAQALTVRYRVGGTATPAASAYQHADYQTLPGVVVIPAGQAEQTVPVQVVDTEGAETPETVIVALAGSLDYAIGTPAHATVIIDDNATAKLIVSETTAACSGQGAGPMAYIRVSRLGSTRQALTVPLEVQGRRLWKNVWYDFKDVPAAAAASYGLYVDGQAATALSFPIGVAHRVISLKAMHPVAEVPSATVVIDPGVTSRKEHPIRMVGPQDQISLSASGTDLVEGSPWRVTLTPASPTASAATPVRLALSGQATLNDYTVSASVSGLTVTDNELVLSIPATVPNSSQRQVILTFTPKKDGLEEKVPEHLVVQFKQTQTGAALAALQQGQPYVAGRIRDTTSAPVLPLDVDGDGLPDAFEVAHGTDPLVRTDWVYDEDRDGLSDREELRLGTRYDQADTDGDGISDFVEGLLGLRPLTKDAATAVPPIQELVPVRVRTAGTFRERDNACYRCHAPGMQLGGVTLSESTAMGGGDGSGVLDQVLFLPVGSSHPFNLLAPLNHSPTAQGEQYDAEILPAGAGPAGFVVLDHSTPLLGRSRSYTSTTFTRSGTLRVLRPPRLAVDADRDGTIRWDASDATRSERPYRFWINNDDDSSEGGGNMEGKGNDSDDYQIRLPRDLEDFSRLWLDVDGVIDLLISGDVELALEWRNVVGAPAIQLYPAVESNGGRGYLQDMEVARQHSLSHSPLPAYATAVVDKSLTRRTIKPGTRFIFQKAAWSSLPQRRQFYFLWEATAIGKGDLVAVVLRGNQVVAESAPLHLRLLDVRQMYHQAEGLPAEGFPEPYRSLSQQPVLPRLGLTETPPIDFRDEQPISIVFVHGWNMSQRESLTFADTMYKRLWHQGFRGRFALFRWPTDDLFGLEVLDPNLHTSFNFSEHRAWVYGAVLKMFLERLPTEMDRNVVAHSMGGVVLTSALRNGAALRTGIYMQAAIPASVFDSRPTLNYSPLVAAEPASSPLFETPDAYAAERGYRGLLSPVEARLFNYYNEDDFALQTGDFVYGLIKANWIVNQIQQRPHLHRNANGVSYSWPGGRKGMMGPPRFWLYRPEYKSFGRQVISQQEIWAFNARSRSKALGAEGRTANLVAPGRARNLGDWKMLAARADHSGQFTRTIQELVPFYTQLLRDVVEE